MLKDRNFWRLLFWFSTLLILVYQVQTQLEITEGLDSAETVEHYRKKLKKMSKGELGGDHVRIGFFDKFKKKPNTIGFCTFDVQQFSFVIGLKKSYWNKSNPRQRLLLLAHEFGHCDCLKWGHTKTLRQDGCPKHFMYPEMPHKYCINRYWEDYARQITEPCDRIRRHR